MDTLRPSATCSQTAVDYESLSSHPARLVARKPERGVRDIGRQPGSAKRLILAHPGFHNFWDLLDQVCRQIRKNWGPDESGSSAGANGIDPDSALCELQSHRFR